MAQLAIKAHPTRTKEVIEILEMLGGKNRYHFKGDEDEWFVLNENIQRSDRLFAEKGFTLEEFLEKYPYKVGDKVHNIIHNENQTITDLVWGEGEVLYQTNNNEYVYVNYLQPYKEETMEERKFSELRMPLDDDDKLATEMTIDGNKILPPNGYLIGKITQVDNGILVEYVKKQPKYPKTYEECCKVLGVNSVDNDNRGYRWELLCQFQELLINRDAYWRIAGDWEPDWSDNKTCYYAIKTCKNDISLLSTLYIEDCILVFPTEEMRDVFCENFRELIELVKELL